VADVQFEIKGEKGSISVDTFRTAINKAFVLLREFDSALSGKPRGILGWYVYDLYSGNGDLAIAVKSRLKPPALRKRLPDTSTAVAQTFVDGFDELEHEGSTPPYLSEGGMIHAQEMVSLIGKNGARGFRVKAVEKEVEITQATSENIRKLLPIRRTAIGSIEGKLEQISIHRGAKFIVYHAITNKAVTCQFHEEFMLDRVKAALGQRVNVFGELQKNFKGETLRIKVEDFRVMGEKSMIPRDRVFPEPEFTDAENTAELLRRIRGG
jgi:hypothetical protein